MFSTQPRETEESRRIFRKMEMAASAHREEQSKVHPCCDMCGEALNWNCHDWAHDDSAPMKHDGKTICQKCYDKVA